MTTGSTLPVVANLFAAGFAVSPEGPQRSGGPAQRVDTAKPRGVPGEHPLARRQRQHLHQRHGEHRPFQTNAGLRPPVPWAKGLGRDPARADLPRSAFHRLSTVAIPQARKPRWAGGGKRGGGQVDSRLGASPYPHMIASRGGVFRELRTSPLSISSRGAGTDAAAGHGDVDMVGMSGADVGTSPVSNRCRVALSTP